MDVADRYYFKILDPSFPKVVIVPGKGHDDNSRENGPGLLGRKRVPV
jgi:hypothetical protein